MLLVVKLGGEQIFRLILSGGGGPGWFAGLVGDLGGFYGVGLGFCEGVLGVFFLLLIDTMIKLEYKTRSVLPLVQYGLV